MPLSGAERQRIYRDRKKQEEQYPEFTKKQTGHVRKFRKKEKEQETLMTKMKLKEKVKVRRLNTRMRVSAHRLRKSEKSKQHAPFKSAMAFAKASARARRVLNTVLPRTPKRRNAVCRKLYSQELGESSLITNSMNSRTSGLPEQTIQLVTYFYNQDDVSRLAPGMKDAITLKNPNGTKQKVQTRHLTSSVAEVYSLFRQNHPAIKIGRSKFADLRPKNVLLSNKLPHNVCLCRYHENFINGVNALHKNIPDFPMYSSAFTESLVCDPTAAACWRNECQNCQNCKGFKSRWGKLIDGYQEHPVFWHDWQFRPDGRVSKVLEEGNIGELLTHLFAITPHFLEHCYIKRQQASEYQKERETACENHAMIQVDFAENYTCMAQDEIQSAHWKQNQVSLFTTATWIGQSLQSLVIASDLLIHSKETVIPYLSRLLGTLPENIKTVSIWSDGPASQFKNRFVFSSLRCLEEAHNLQIRWNFFATSHGKGPVDGIGGAIKRFVWSQVKNRKHHVFNAETFAAASTSMEKVHCIEMTEVEINSMNLKLGLARIFTDAPSIPGIMKINCVQNIGGVVVTYFFTKDCHQSGTNLYSTENDDFAINDWVVVEYDGRIYPGEIITVKNSDYKVTVMVESGNNWKWPQPRDAIFYPRINIIHKVEKPIPVNSRGHYSFRQNFSSYEKN